MSKRSLSEGAREGREKEAEVTRRKRMLMAGALGITQAALLDRLVNLEWQDHYAGGVLDGFITNLFAEG